MSATVRRLTHPAARAFDRAARAYELGRPGYPPAALRHLLRVAGLGRGRTVVELGSGTGKLTRLLRPSGAAIVAVEPSGPMREVFGRAVPDVLVLEGTAERIPLPDGVADAVVAAQAFHWFQPRRALREIRRVLGPGGMLVGLWNVGDTRGPLALAVERLIDRFGGARPRRWQRWESAFEAPGSGFGRLRRVRFRHVVERSPEAAVAQALSVSRIAALPPARRQELARELRGLLARARQGRASTTLRVPTVTEVYWCRRAARGRGLPGRRRRHSGAPRRSGRTSPAKGRPVRRRA